MKKKIVTVLSLAFVTIVGRRKQDKSTGRTKRNPVVLKDSKSRAMSAEMLESVK
jgi:hypothetical protein